jgi:hypothetical protein
MKEGEGQKIEVGAHNEEERGWKVFLFCRKLFGGNMENQFYISLIITLGVILLGFFVEQSREVIIVFFPLAIFIYMGFNFKLARSTFNFMWLFFLLPFILFTEDDLSFLFFNIIYIPIYLAILILFNIQKGKSSEEKIEEKLPLKKKLLILIIGIILGLIVTFIIGALLVFLLSR